MVYRRRGNAACGLDGWIGGEVGNGDDEAADVEVGSHLVDDGDCKVEVSARIEEETQVDSGGGLEEGVAEERVDKANEEGQKKFREERGV